MPGLWLSFAALCGLVATVLARPQQATAAMPDVGRRAAPGVAE
jgi:hypothetical protein